MTGVLAGVPVVWHIRDIYRDESTFIRMLSKPFYPLARKVIAISNAVAKAFIEESGLPGKVKVVYNGVDLARFDPGGINISKIKDELDLDGIFPLIGVVGVLGRWKGQEEFLQAASQLVKVFPKAKFLIVGDSLIDDRGYKERLKGMLTALGITSHVIFTGFREDIPEILGCLNLLVLPSHNEPFGRVLVEAMAMERAVVGTDSGGVPEIVIDGKTGLLVPPHNADLLASSMTKILKDEHKLEEMGRLGRKRVEILFTVENYVKGVIKIYTEIFT
jgi:glycosyltransferase involved in cell wall biosynthesis